MVRVGWNSVHISLGSKFCHFVISDRSPLYGRRLRRWREYREYRGVPAYMIRKLKCENGILYQKENPCSISESHPLSCS